MPNSFFAFPPQVPVAQHQSNYIPNSKQSHSNKIEHKIGESKEGNKRRKKSIEKPNNNLSDLNIGFEIFKNGLINGHLFNTDKSNTNKISDKNDKNKISIDQDNNNIKNPSDDKTENK